MRVKFAKFDHHYASALGVDDNDEYYCPDIERRGEVVLLGHSIVIDDAFDDPVSVSGENPKP